MQLGWLIEESIASVGLGGDPNSHSCHDGGQKHDFNAKEVFQLVWWDEEKRKLQRMVYDVGDHPLGGNARRGRKVARKLCVTRPDGCNNLFAGTLVARY